MKKHLRLLPLIFIPLVLASCNTNEESAASVVSSATESVSVVTTTSEQSSAPVSTQSSQSISSAVSTSSISSSISSSSAPTSSSSTQEDPHYEIGQTYTSSSWDKTIQEMVKLTVGDLANKIPTFIASNYEAIVEYATDGADVFLVFEIKCFNPNANSAVRLYREKMIELGYTISSDNTYGYLMKDYYSDLFVSYGVIEADIDYFDIAAVIRTTREAEWNSEAINMYTEIEVPSFSAPAYQTTYDNSKDQMTVFALFVDKNAINQYERILQNAGYTFDTKSTLEMPIYVDPTGYVTVQLYQTYGDYNTDALYIIINNRWPTTSIYAFLGGQITFPKLESNNAVFDNYAYLDEGGQGKDEDYVLVIYYIYATASDFSNYVSTLMTYDYEVESSRTSESGVMSVTLKDYKGYVVVAYNPNTNEIAIAIYQAE